eukprot:scaffold616981_cov31-Prasinocladus_malaysianus.AAC.1
MASPQASSPVSVLSSGQEGAMETLLRQFDVSESTILDVKSQGLNNLWLLLTASDAELTRLGLGRIALQKLRAMEAQAAQDS